MNGSGPDQVKFSEWLQRGFDLYKANLGAWLLASLVALVISVASLGLLAGPMMAGLVWMALAQADRKPALPQAGDVFKGFDYFQQAFLFFVGWGLAFLVVALVLKNIPGVGPLVTLLIALGVHTALMFGPFLIVDRAMPFWPASQASVEKIKPALLPFAGFGIVTGLIGGIGVVVYQIGWSVLLRILHTVAGFGLVAALFGFLGAVVCGVGLIVTLPIAVCMVAAAYRDVFGAPAPLDAARVQRMPSGLNAVAGRGDA